MEAEIEEALVGYFKNIKIDVNYKTLRTYEIVGKIEEMEYKIIYFYNAHLTFDANIDTIKKEIEKCILGYYRR